ncbi:PadR family transcriptional regulator [Blastopirellula marina]|uniref:PadR family transcriptional regulator n=1 Tax=Blastopirellula marina TaxID=124 RepID=A0A2S8FTB9_9BACT|nr:helix-turn-helix transcriptional regulator [Blastopirellula marina]PQO35423.1 PadR family transcriptional regulator [Blastopirellula marina]PTL44063.1 PadR family transcriptional regulator [Blastopirellula marina]
MAETSFSSDLMRSCADLVILTLLQNRPMHGYDIFVSMENIGDGQFRFKQGTLYPLLYRLERSGWIAAKWHVPPEGKKRKMYSITKDGKRVLSERLQQWRRFTDSVNAILKECSDD